MPEREYYAIVESIKPGLFNNQRCITVGNDPREILVDISSLARTKDKFTAVRFNEVYREYGKSTGYVENCEEGATAKMRRIIPIDSLAEPKNITKMLER